MTVLGGVPATLGGVLAAGAVRSVFQPIVDLTTSAVVGYEALARGPAGQWEAPDRLFAAATEQGLLGALDAACRRAAFTGALTRGLTAPLTVFVNIEPGALDPDVFPAGFAEDQRCARGLRVVAEFTERSLGDDPAALLTAVDRVRELGWGVALDDVGADPLSLAFMSLLRPDVVKLDLRLVQQHPDPGVAQIMNAVNGYAERSGAVILAEGIETPRHLTMARALGATLCQGWLLGRPTPHPGPGADPRSGAPPGSASRSEPAGSWLRAPLLPWQQQPTRATTPFGSLPPDMPLRHAPKSLLVEVSKQLEREAVRLGPTAVMAATFQHAHHFTAATAARYRQLTDRVGFVGVLGADLPAHLGPGLRSTPLAPGDPVCADWDIVVLDPHFAVALLARDLGDIGPDADRTFEFALTYNRGTVEHAAHLLLSKIAARTGP